MKHVIFTVAALAALGSSAFAADTQVNNERVGKQVPTAQSKSAVESKIKPMTQANIHNKDRKAHKAGVAAPKSTTEEKPKI